MKRPYVNLNSENTIQKMLDSLNYEPMHSIFKRRCDKIVLDKSSLLSLKPEDMYVWMYKIANEARKKFHAV